MIDEFACQVCCEPEMRNAAFCSKACYIAAKDNRFEAKMKLEHPLLGLINNCATVCEPECCGIDAYDFSPFHIASFLIRYTSRIDEKELEKIKSQLTALDENYGATGCTLEEMNQVFTGNGISALIRAIDAALDRACELISTEPTQTGPLI